MDVISDITSERLYSVNGPDEIDFKRAWKNSYDNLANFGSEKVPTDLTILFVSQKIENMLTIKKVTRIYINIEINNKWVMFQKSESFVSTDQLSS